MIQCYQKKIPILLKFTLWMWFIFYSKFENVLLNKGFSCLPYSLSWNLFEDNLIQLLYFKKIFHAKLTTWLLIFQTLLLSNAYFEDYLNRILHIGIVLLYYIT